MYVSDWVPPEMRADDATRPDGVRYPLLAFVIVISLAIAMVLACGYAGQRVAFAAHAAVEQC